MGEFLGWVIFTVALLFLIVIILMHYSEKESTISALTFICGFLSCLLAVLLSSGTFYYLK